MTRQAEPKDYTGQAARRADLLTRRKFPSKRKTERVAEIASMYRNDSKETMRQSLDGSSFFTFFFLSHRGMRLLLSLADDQC